MKVASAIATARQPSAELVMEVIESARVAAGLARVESMLLFLTSDFSADITHTLRAVARTAGTTQIFGCTAMGLATEEEWVLDGAAAAVLVFGEGVGIAPAPVSREPDQLLTLAAPSAINQLWLNSPGSRFGGVAGDATGQGPYAIFRNAGSVMEGNVDLRMNGMRCRAAAGHGYRPLADALAVTACQGFTISSLDGMPPWQSLQRVLPGYERATSRRQLETRVALLVEMGHDIVPCPLLCLDEGSITITRKLEPGQRVFWGLRQALYSEQETASLLEAMTADTNTPPSFGLMFTSAGRGPAFYGGEDLDLQQFRRHFPNTPLLGLYGNGQIAPGQPTRMLDNSVVFSLCWPTL
ncbi:small ligand-binding sensory domain FIST [Chitinivorax tropicus]|uniref:Small ligand-binding sensory domain FIST n=1 Tax=Chitinivorax tropicus TaxID=714531 RepID=A0A840MPY0_9PROT|nr:FIST N-terminal domain-containing protein [Chitinivorax tropicus]MBB5019505.1 small ligand-binding sensory domain FIST [Chitinivorax tropicus]